MDAHSDRQRNTGRLPVVLLAACLLPQAAPGRAAPDPVATVQRLSGELDLQTRLPGEKREEAHESTPSDFKLRIPGATTILWTALAIGAAFALWALRDLIPGLRRRTPDLPAEAAATVDVAAVARMAEAGDDADELAQVGRFAEAMHLLLLRALAEMRARLKVTLADSLTSREILRVVALPDDGRQALDDLIGRVERVHFGAKPATADDYDACRGTFERLIGAMLAPAAPVAPSLAAPVAPSLAA